MEINCKLTISYLVLTVTIFVFPGCSDAQAEPDINALLGNGTTTTTASTHIDSVGTTSQTGLRIIGSEGSNQRRSGDDFFWNESPAGFPECGTAFGFNHHLVAVDDVNAITFGPGSHIAPHEHMAYWDPGPVGRLGQGLRSRRVQLYAPTDIFRIDVRKETRTTPEGESYFEWGAYLYACDGHQLMLGHVGGPSDDMLAILAEVEPECDEFSCNWVSMTLIQSGTPIFRSSGYAGAFDFGLSLLGLTSEQLQEQPGYGYSITPWRVPSGNSVCPLEYFPEPFRSDYLKVLGEFKCGPFNQDVPGTAMGFWLPSPSPGRAPRLFSEREVDEWETIWLFQSQIEPWMHTMTVGNNTFGLDYGQYGFRFASEGLVNSRWDQVKPGLTYCAELRELIDHQSFSQRVEMIIVIRLSDDGTALTVEARNGDQCGYGPWSFGGGERTFYR